MKSNIKILAACSFMMASMASCDLTGINDNPDKPTDDVNYNMSEPRLASTLRGGMIIDGDVEQRLKPLQIDFYSQMLVDGGGWAASAQLRILLGRRQELLQDLMLLARLLQLRMRLRLLVLHHLQIQMQVRGCTPEPLRKAA